MLELQVNGPTEGFVPTVDKKEHCQKIAPLQGVTTNIAKAKKYGTGRRKRLNGVSKKAQTIKNNLIQELLDLFGQKPLNCRCGNCKSGEIVVCEKCWQLKPYCLNQPFNLVCNDCLKR